jgi:hypothetical protein
MAKSPKPSPAATKPALAPDALIATSKAGRIRLIEKRQPPRKSARRESEKSHVIPAKAGTH